MSSNNSSSNNSSNNSSSDEDEINPHFETLPDPQQNPDLFFLSMATKFMKVASAFQFEEPKPPKRHRQFIHRDRESGGDRLYRDYFAPEPVYGPQYFRRHFRMRRELFLRIVNALEIDPFFQQRPDAVGRACFSPIQKCTAAIRQLAYGTSVDFCDEYLHIRESTALACLKKFCQAVVRIFSGIYLRSLTAADVQRLIAMHEAKHGFPKMWGSLDCMHWAWKNCPVAWHGAYNRGDQGEPIIILEAVASQDLWIWHAFFGIAGSNNDINVLNQSTLFNNVLAGNEQAMHFVANNSHHTRSYYLTDGIYPDWPVFVKSFSFPSDEKKQRFKVMQEAARKDVERAFGVLRARWGIVRGSSLLWKQEHMSCIMFTCIILHNMIIEDETVESIDGGESYLVAFHEANLKMTADQRLLPNEGDKRWIPPRRGLLRLDVDFSFHEVSGAAGVGFLVRDCEGKIIAAASHRVGRTETLLMGELHALLLGVGFCLSNDIGLLVVFSDSILVVHVVSEVSKGSNSLCDKLFEAFAHAKEHIVLEFRHVRREANRAAHCLANFVAWSIGVTIWKLDFPSWLLDVVHRDLI